MALEYGYFDSEITGYDEEGMPIFDRAKTSDFMADFFSKLITSGVLADPADCFQVVAYDGLTVEIKPGYGYIKGRFAYDKDSAYLTLEDAPTVSAYKRIDMVVLRNNYADRLCELIIKTGTPSANPIEPTLIQADAGDYYELCLATIYINSNQTVISQSNITDTRFNDSYCGAVTQLIDHLDTSVFFAQLTQFYTEFVSMCENSYASSVDDLAAYLAALQESGDSQLAAIVAVMQNFEAASETAFLEWFQNIKDQLSEDQAGNLQNQIDDLGDYLRAYSECETELDTAEKAVTCDNFLLAKGATIRVKFTAYREASGRLTDDEENYIVTSSGDYIRLLFGMDATAANPTLNVNALGAYPIYYRGQPAASDHFCMNRTFDLVFNGAQFEVVGDLNMSGAYQKDTEITLPAHGLYQIILTHGTRENCNGLYLYSTITGRVMAVKAASAVTITAEGRNLIFECTHNPVLHYIPIP